MMTRSKRKLEARQSLAAKPNRQIKLKQQIPRGHVSSSGSSNRPCQLRRHCQVRGCQENMAYQGSSLEILASAASMDGATASPASTEETTSSAEAAASMDKEVHMWTEKETDYLFSKLNSVKQRKKFKRNQRGYHTVLAEAMNKKFRPLVRFTSDKIRSRMNVIRNQWDKQGLQVPKLPTDDTLPVSLFDKYHETMLALYGTKTTSSSSVQPSETVSPRWTRDGIIGHMTRHVDGKKILIYQDALRRNKSAVSVFHHYTTLEEQIKFLDDISKEVPR